MKRFLAYNSLVVVTFLALWILLVVVEVKINLFSFLKFIYIGSLALVFVAFFVASWQALRPFSRHPIAIAAVSSLLMSPTVIFLGGALATNFKFLIGGHV
jgi:hypothetical protein